MAIRHEKPDNPVLAQDHTNLGKLLYLDERFEDALEESQARPARSSPTIVDAHVLQIQVLLKLRRYDEVIRSCDVALAKGKKSALLYELRGLAQAARDDYPGAIRDYGRALELRPDDGGLLVRTRLGVPGLRLAQTGAGRLRSGDQARSRPTATPTTAAARPMRGSATTARPWPTPARHSVSARPSPRVTYNAARIYAVAASVAAAEVGEKGRLARLLSSQYQDIAVQLIREAFEREAPEKRAAFWRERSSPTRP